MFSRPSILASCGTKPDTFSVIYGQKEFSLLVGMPRNNPKPQVCTA